MKVPFLGKLWTLRQLCKEKGLVEYSVFRRRLSRGIPIPLALILPPNTHNPGEDFLILYLYQSGKYSFKEITEILNIKNPRRVETLIYSLNNKDSKV